MAGESIHDKLNNVRKPRVHITYQVETEGAVVSGKKVLVSAARTESVAVPTPSRADNSLRN